jgi:hypothetical protein
MLTVTTVTNFCFTYPNWDGLYTPPLNSWKIGKWLKTLEKVGFSKVFENGEKLNPPSPPLCKSFELPERKIIRRKSRLRKLCAPPSLA